MKPRNGNSIIKAIAGFIIRLPYCSFQVRAWHLALLGMLALSVYAQRTEVQSSTPQSPAGQSTWPPLNPQGQPWVQADSDGGLGYTDTPFIPGQRWRVHDSARPRPRIVTPGAEPGKPPSDAVVLFDGKDLSDWVTLARGETGATIATEPKWIIENGALVPVHGTGNVTTKEKFGSIQLHLEFQCPTEIIARSQLRANSGVLLMGRYEIQVLDSYQNPTYADGSAGSIYGMWPPLVNASRKPGEWQTYDIVWEAPDFDHMKPGYLTLLHNGVIVQNHQAYLGATAHKRVGVYTPHAPEEPLSLQNHDPRVKPRFRNIWVRKLTGYDEP